MKMTSRENAFKYINKMITDQTRTLRSSEQNKFLQKWPKSTNLTTFKIKTVTTYSFFLQRKIIKFSTLIFLFENPFK